MAIMVEGEKSGRRLQEIHIVNSCEKNIVNAGDQDTIHIVPSSHVLWINEPDIAGALSLIFFFLNAWSF